VSRLRRTLRRLLHHQGGASALEFALVAVPLLLIIVGTVEYGRALWTQQAMQSLAISTARCIGVQQTQCTNSGTYNANKTSTWVIGEAAKLGVPLQAVNLTVNASTTCRGVAGFATVTISYVFVSAAPQFVTSLLLGPTLRAEACFPVQS
jgi:Flp pilus assembly protein TadG